MVRSIAIGGFMGVGKSTVGRRLSQRYGCDFIDLDQQIEERCGMTVSEVFEDRGEVGFREVEAECLAVTLNGPPVVLALGGGTLHFGSNCQNVQASATLFCLGLPLAEIRRRLGSTDRRRPLWSDAERLYEKRMPLYQTAGTFVDVMGKSVEEVVEYLYTVSTCE